MELSDGNDQVANGLRLQEENAEVRGLVLTGFTANAITVGGGDAATGNIIAGNFIGTSHDGRGRHANGAAGVAIIEGARDKVVGETDRADRNLLSGNGEAGVLIAGVGPKAIGSSATSLALTATAALPSPDGPAQDTGIGVNSRGEAERDRR